ncbi:hypothetical protein M9H77_03153 [Catharanthus roseus]|uniref:Uncharacterized protein n=1 Tax=Catharanthus roseus TaxID=4058 RepID=A0ACC0CAM8_CATRO|nr:hypothetical protein M9H77_03153 [Catharanthus roseus]
MGYAKNVGWAYIFDQHVERTCTVRGYSPVRGHLPNDMLGSVTLDLDPVDRGRSTIGGSYFLAGWVRRGSPARVAQGGLVGNFMTKMTELLEATLSNRRGERTQNTTNNGTME